MGRWHGRWCGVVVVVAIMLPAVVAQTPPEAPTPQPPAVAPQPVPSFGGLIVDGVPIDSATVGQVLAGKSVGCSSCGGGGCAGCGGSTHCVPGRPNCDRYPADGVLGRFVGAIYDCVCCPDPCYIPQWTTLANAAFYVDGARPATMTRLRWDSGIGLILPDRAEYFWARADGKGLGPAPRTGFAGERRVNYNDLVMITEAAVGGFSMISELSYRSLETQDTPGGAGFGDMAIGTKSLLCDCELFQIAYQFKTYLPTGQSRKGLGNGHVSLEPSVILGVQISEDCFFQGQVCQWIPLGGDPGYDGSVLHYHASFNGVLCRPVRDLSVIGTMEFNGYSFQSGSYTDPIYGQRPANGATYFSLGPGFRVAFCNKLDFGFGTAFAVTDPHFAETQIRSEFRYRY